MDGVICTLNSPALGADIGAEGEIDCRKNRTYDGKLHRVGFKLFGADTIAEAEVYALNEKQFYCCKDNKKYAEPL